jgi:hypothetical protein
MVSVHETEKLRLEVIEKFLLDAKQVRFQASQQEEIYVWIERLLCQQEYLRQGRPARGLRRRYIAKMTGLGRAQLTRLVGCYLATGQVRSQGTGRHHLPRRHTAADIELLAPVDEAHESFSGPATRRILEREFRVYGKAEFERLAAISMVSCTTCAATRAIGKDEPSTRRHDPLLWPLGSGVDLIPWDNLLPAGRYSTPR